MAGGRPKKTNAEKRSERFNLRFTEAEIEHLRLQAQAAGIEPHEYARRRVLGERAHLPSQPSVLGRRADPALVSELNRIGVNVNQLTRATHRGSDFAAYWREVGDELRAALAQVLRHGS